MLWVAVAFGALAALCNMIFFSKVEGARVVVLKARSRITAGSKVNESMFVPISIYGEDLKQLKSLVVEQKDLGVFSQIPLAESVETGEVLFQSSFRFDANRGIREAIGPNQRAIALQVKDEANAVAYLVRPGDTADVYVNGGDGKGSNAPLIQNALIRAVGDATVVPPDSGSTGFRYRSITVVVPQEEVGRILLALGDENKQVTLALAGRTKE
jgi:Flp pilus assembly protein CpaB